MIKNKIKELRNINLEAKSTYIDYILNGPLKNEDQNYNTLQYVVRHYP